MGERKKKKKGRRKEQRKLDKVQITAPGRTITHRHQLVPICRKQQTKMANSDEKKNVQDKEVKQRKSVFCYQLQMWQRSVKAQLNVSAHVSL